MRWDAGSEDGMGAALVQALRLGQWLVLLDMHTAPRAQLLELVGGPRKG